MNRKQILTLLAALIVVGALGFWMRQRDASSWRSGSVSAGTKVLPEFDVNAVAQVAITSGERSMHLVQKEGVWTVRERADYPASFTQVAALIRKLGELKVGQSVPVGPSQLGRLNLEAPAKDQKNGGTQIDLLDAQGKRLAALLLGKPLTRKSPGLPEEAGGMPIGRYVMAANGGGKAVLVNVAFLNATGAAETWLDRTFFQMSEAQAITNTPPTSADGWAVSRAKEGEDWKLESPQAAEKVDVAKVTAAASALQQPTFTDVRAGSDAGFPKATKLVVKTFDHFTYDLTIGAPEGEVLPVKVAISADFPPKRLPGTKETPEEKTRLDAEFANQTKQAHDKLLVQQRMASWVYLIPKTQLEAALVPRSGLLAPAPTPTPVPGVSPSAIR